MFAAFTLQQKLIGGLISLAILAAAVFVLYSFGYGKGYTAGALSNAEPLAKCRTQVTQMEATYRALADENEQLRLVSEKLTQDVSDAWIAAASSVKPRIIRVRDKNCSDGEMRVPDSTGKPDETTSEPGLGEAGITPLSIAEINDRLNRAEMDAAQLAHLISWIKDQQGIYK